MRNALAVSLLVVLLAPALAAQSVIVGSQRAAANYAIFVNPPATLIDLSHPAATAGTVTVASVNWVGFGTVCTSAFKVKILRPASISSLTTFTLVAERGPFTGQPGVNIVPLSPGVPVKFGDLMAVTSLVSSQTCGGPGVSRVQNATTMMLNGDVSSGSFNGSLFRDNQLLARATDTSEVLEGVITAAGSLQGGFGAFFRTSVQITPGSREDFAAGKLVFHRAGVAASSSDPAIPYTISNGGVLSFNDVVQAMGTSGLGSIDVISTSGAPPVITARVFNDEGTKGTSGFTEEMVTRDEALDETDTATFITPADLANYRVNIGVRTFSTPVTLTVQYGSRAFQTLDFPANYFQQYSLATLTNIEPIPNERLRFFINGGTDVSIYASTTDNRTNDSAIRILHRE